MHPEIVAFGEPMVEFNQVKEGDGRSFLQGFGGDTSNAMIAAARQGARAGYISAIGQDVYGAMLRRLWDEEKVDHRDVRTDPEAFTGIYFVTHGPEGHSFSFFRAGSAASRYRAQDLPFEVIASAKILHISGISLAISTSACDAAYAAIHAARAAKVLVSFDTNLRLKLWPKDRARAVMRDVIALCDICLPSYDDITVLTGLTKTDAILDEVLGLGAKIVALKLGKDGAVIADGTRRVTLPPHPVTPVDATGAGDTFGGAFLARIAAGDDIVEAGRYAGVAAALSTQGYGAVAPIPRTEEVRRAMGGA